MKGSKLLSALSFVQCLDRCLAASPQTSNIDSSGSLVSPSDPSVSLNGTANLTAPYRYYVPDTTIALDFYEYQAMSTMPRQDVLMCIVEGLSKIFGHDFTEPVPSSQTFYYKRAAFIHIQDLNPTPGREHTYGDTAATLRGVAEWMTQVDYFKALEFQIWSITTAGTAKIGSGGLGR